MKYKCYECGKVHPFKYLMLDTNTKKYLCPTCHRNSLAKKERDNFSIIPDIIEIILLLLLLFLLLLMR